MKKKILVLFFSLLAILAVFSSEKKIVNFKIEKLEGESRWHLVDNLGNTDYGYYRSWVESKFISARTILNTYYAEDKTLGEYNGKVDINLVNSMIFNYNIAWKTHFVGSMVNFGVSSLGGTGFMVAYLIVPLIISTTYKYPFPLVVTSFAINMPGPFLLIFLGTLTFVPAIVGFVFLGIFFSKINKYKKSRIEILEKLNSKSINDKKVSINIDFDVRFDSGVSNFN